MARETVHSLDSKDAAVVAQMRAMAAAHKGELTREGFDALIERVPDAEGVSYEPGTVGGVPGMWCRPEDARTDGVLLYIHGGAFIVGSARAYRHLAGQIAARANLPAFVADYRLAPENPFPAAVTDARAAYRGLVAAYPDARVAIVGDSAGGGLALSLLTVAKAEASAPFAAVLLSPWADLALTSASLETRADDDPFLTKAALAGGASSYLRSSDARDPLASPLYADLSDLPPVQIHVGTLEVLFDDATRIAARVQDAKGDAALHVWEGMPHVFPSNVGTLAAASQALDLIATFLTERLVTSRREK